MSNPIYDRGWLNVVFEGRNQRYGAYQLRRQSGKTTLLAFMAAILLMGVIAGVPAMASKIQGQNPEIADGSPFFPKDTVIPVKLTDPDRFVYEKKSTSGKKPIAQTKPAKKFVKMVPSRNQVTENPPTNAELEGSAISSVDVAGDAKGGENLPANSDSGGSGGNSGESGITSGGGEPMMTGMLDRSPEFPGGIQRFYEFVGRNFRAPEENTGKIKVTVSFVVEKDGSLTDVKVLRNPGFGMDKEALRVLKSLKTKWSPGIYKGQQVRTLYTLPIIVEPSS